MITFLLSIIFNALYLKEQSNLFAAKESLVYEVASQAGYFLVESNLTIKTVAYSINDLQDAGASDDEIRDFLEDQARIYSNTVNNDFTALYGVFRGKFHDGKGWTPAEGYDPTSRPWYQAAVEAKGEVALVSPYVDTKTTNVMMSISKLLPDRESVVSIDVALNDLQKIVEESVANGNWLYSLILDANGFVVAHSNSEELGKEYLEEDESFGKQVAERLLVDESPYFEVEHQGKHYYVFAEHVLNTWHAICIIEKDVLNEPLKQTWFLFYAMLITFLGSIVLVFLRFNVHRGIENTLAQQISVLTDMYEMIWYLRLKKDVYYEADPITGTVDLTGPGKERAEYALRSFMDGITDERFKKSAFVFIDFATLGRRMKGKNQIKFEFLDISNRRCEVRFVAVNWDENEEPAEVLWLMEVEEQAD
ncbi:MAG: cache domain-containing protein [Lachnospiraceae bacterium]|nr:cache domain-containing protein [Lachnospiraceae bacterium]